MVMTLSTSRRGHLASTSTGLSLHQVSSNLDTCYGVGEAEVLSTANKSPPALRYFTSVSHLF